LASIHSSILHRKNTNQTQPNHTRPISSMFCGCSKSLSPLSPPLQKLSSNLSNLCLRQMSRHSHIIAFHLQLQLLHLCHAKWHPSSTLWTTSSTIVYNVYLRHSQNFLSVFGGHLIMSMDSTFNQISHTVATLAALAQIIFF
jgi:hypothetical protein